MLGPWQTGKNKIRIHHCHQKNPQKDHYMIYGKDRLEMHTKFNRNQEEMRRACKIFFYFACRSVCSQNLYGNCLQGGNCTHLMSKEEEEEDGEQGRRNKSFTLTIGSCPWDE